MNINLVLAAADSDLLYSDEITVTAKSLRAHDEVQYSTQSVAIEQPASDVYLGETLAKLPGVMVRNVSGFGSTTTVITAQALGAGGTSVSLDDIPILDPLGRGVNFSLFPSTLIQSVQHHSAFYPTVDATQISMPAPGGRINLKSLAAPKRGEKRWVGSVLVGTGSTVEGTAAFRAGNEKKIGSLV